MDTLHWSNTWINTSFSVNRRKFTTRYFTFNFLLKDKVNFRLVIEPQEFDKYAKHYDSSIIITTPFKNLGQGSIPVRNFVWEHSKSIGAKRHWIMDDNIRNIYGAIIVFSFTLYPYVYIISRTAFLSQSISLIEAGRTLGLSKFQVFHKLSIPLIRPAVIAGLSLVIMEVLSDFGAVEHFSIVTFTTGIFRTWYGMYDLKTAMQLSSILLLFITFFILLEKYSRGNQIYSKPGGSSNTYLSLIHI